VSRPHGQGRSSATRGVVDGRGDGFSLSTHKHPNVQAWLAKNPRITMHFTPTSGSWLNMVEIFFGIITCQAIRRGTFRSVKDLIAAIETFIDGWNDRCEPFVWTKTADDIISKARPRQTISNTQH
jgi:DDE superfamily endonuclease